MTTTTIFPQRR